RKNDHHLDEEEDEDPDRHQEATDENPGLPLIDVDRLVLGERPATAQREPEKKAPGDERRCAECDDRLPSEPGGGACAHAAVADHVVHRRAAAGSGERCGYDGRETDVTAYAHVGQ